MTNKKSQANKKRYHDPATGYRDYQLKANKEYYRKHRERLIESQKIYNEQHKDSIREYMRNYMRKKKNV